MGTHLIPHSEGAPDPGTDASYELVSRRIADYRRHRARIEKFSQMGQQAAKVLLPRAPDADETREATVAGSPAFDQAVGRIRSLMASGQVTREQVETQIRLDEDRVRGWEVVHPPPGSHGSKLIKDYQQRIAIRKAVLAQEPVLTVQRLMPAEEVNSESTLVPYIRGDRRRKRK